MRAFSVQKYSLTIADGQTTASYNLEGVASGKILLIHSTAPELGGSLTYSVSVTNNAGTVIFTKASLADNGEVIINPAGESSGNYFPNGIPFCNVFAQGVHKLKITASSAVTGAQTFTGYVLIEE